jgi:hypothetical protein
MSTTFRVKLPFDFAKFHCQTSQTSQLKVSLYMFIAQSLISLGVNKSSVKLLSLYFCLLCRPPRIRHYTNLYICLFFVLRISFGQTFFGIWQMDKLNQQSHTDPKGIDKGSGMCFLVSSAHINESPSFPIFSTSPQLDISSLSWFIL